MGDDKKQRILPNGARAHETTPASMPSGAVSFPPILPNRHDNNKTSLNLAPGSGSSEGQPMQQIKQRSDERSGERSMSMASSMQDSHDSPPKLSFRQDVPRASDTKIRRPITLRPSSLDPRTSIGFPSLKQEDLDEGDIQNLPLAAPNGFIKRMPLNAPQLRIRPILKKELNMPSPLARRGAAEREYLQGQLKAEALRRRKQEQHNEERKLRWNANIAPVNGFKGDVKDDEEILSMIEKFKFGFGDGALAEDKKNLKSLPNRSIQDLRGFAASPPAILKKTFKRSVSAVLAESGIDEDGNLLFFPDGVPLLRDEDEIASNDVTNGATIDCDGQDNSHGRRCSFGKVDGRSEDESESGSISQESSSSDDLSPSLIAADVIWQLGAAGSDGLPRDFSMPTTKGNKKMTLRPKMSAPSDNGSSAPLPDRQFKTANGCESSNSAQSKGNINASNICAHKRHPVSNQYKDHFKFETPDKFYPGSDDLVAASESFHQMHFGNEDKMESGNCAHSSNRQRYTNGGNMDKKHPFVFSSPEAGFNCKREASADEKDSNLFPPAPPSDLSDSNYYTPDNSEHRPRKQLGKMPKVPELCMPHTIDLKSRRIMHNDKSSLPLKVSVEEGNMLSPETAATGFSLKEPLSDSDFCTPDNSLHERRSSRKHPGERMPKLPEFSMPDIESNFPKVRFQGSTSLSLCAAEEENSFSREIIRGALCESKFCTPENAIDPFSKHLCEQMPKLPEFSMPGMDFRGKSLLASNIAVEDENRISPQKLAKSLLLKMPLSESNFITPDDPIDPLHKHSGEQMPKMPEFSMPNFDSKGKDLLSLGVAAGEEKEFSPAMNRSAPLFKKTPMESNFSTPNNSVDSFSKHLGAKIPKLPDIATPLNVGSNEKTLPSEKIQEQLAPNILDHTGVSSSQKDHDPIVNTCPRLHHHETIKTPC